VQGLKKERKPRTVVGFFTRGVDDSSRKERGTAYETSRRGLAEDSEPRGAFRRVSIFPGNAGSSGGVGSARLRQKARPGREEEFASGRPLNLGQPGAGTHVEAGGIEVVGSPKRNPGLSDEKKKKPRDSTPDHLSKGKSEDGRVVQREGGLPHHDQDGALILP